MKIPTLFLFAAILGLSACRKEVTKVSQVDQAFSAKYDIMPGDWTTADNGLSYSTSFDIPELTDAIFDHGAVVVYLSFEDKIYEALPEVYQGIAYGAIHSPGAITVDIHALDGGTINPPADEVLGKVILIDATQLSLHPGVDLKNYNTVLHTFHVH